MTLKLSFVHCLNFLLLRERLLCTPFHYHGMAVQDIYTLNVPGGRYIYRWPHAASAKLYPALDLTVATSILDIGFSAIDSATWLKRCRWRSLG